MHEHTRNHCPRAIGGMLRFLLENVISTPGFPTSTLIINLAGSFALGFFYTMADEKGIKPWLRNGVSVGLVGSFTTFSTFTLDIIQLGQSRPLWTLIYVLSSILGGLFMVFTGEYLAKWIFQRETRTAKTSESKEVFQ